MDRLWAPWRMAYIERERENAEASRRLVAAVSSVIGPKGDPIENLIVAKGKKAFVLMNIYPYNNGHLMIAPYEHVAKFETLDPETTTEIMSLLQRAMNALNTAFKPHGFNVGMNLGEAAGAGIAQHLHMHVVPRWIGDSNFMPVIGEVKVMPDTLEHSYEKIVAAWEG